MGYVSDRGALGVLTPALTPMQNVLYTRSPVSARAGLLRQWGVVDIPPASVKIAPLAPPSTNPIVKLAQGLLPTTAPLTAPLPTAAETIQKVAPVVPVLLAPSPASAAAAVVQPIVEAASAPPTVKIRLSPASTMLTPVDAPTPTGSSGGGGTVFNADGSTAGAAAAAPPAGDLLATIKNLPPVALLAVALGALVLFGRK